MRDPGHLARGVVAPSKLVRQGLTARVVRPFDSQMQAVLPIRHLPVGLAGMPTEKRSRIQACGTSSAPTSRTMLAFLTS
jgi:hypothetical protein